MAPNCGRSRLAFGSTPDRLRHAAFPAQWRQPGACPLWRILGDRARTVWIDTDCATLRSDAPGSLRDAAIFVMSAPMWASFGALLDSVRSSEPSFVGLHGATVYQYLPRHPDLWAVFNTYMTTQSQLHNAAIVDAYDFSGVRTLVDVGRGHGATPAAVLSGYPTMKGILFDLPEVVGQTERLAIAGQSDRCQVIGGDMLSSVPAGGDAYMIKRVMMDKIDSDAEIILATVSRS
jgi:O-methyltransferase domain